MKINLVWNNEQNKVSVGDKEISLITDCLSAALSAEQFEYEAEISLLFTDNEGIREINRIQRKIDKPTDVLSFPMLEQDEEGVIIYDEDFIEGRVFLGDIVISLEKAVVQAEEYGHSLEREIGFLAVHSLLHLLGYDHELGQAEEQEMFEKQEMILNSLGLVR
ncbi:MAG: rRNA maturation RNase YbeY [Clostridia bacterium]|nr:rRNA maturation RNase YbeY [Clostridia bacterium]